MTLSEPESKELRRLAELSTDPASPPLGAYARGRLRAWRARADGEDAEHLRAVLDGCAAAPTTPRKPDDAYSRGAARAAAHQDHGQETN